MGLIITPTDYDDWSWMPISTAPATSPASMADMNATGIYCWEFTNGKALMFPGLQLPHGYKEGTDCIPHIHWAPSTTATYTGTWTLEYVDWMAATTGTALGAKQTVTVAFNGSMTAFQVQSADFSANISGTNRKISSLAAAKLSLALSAGTSCFLVGIDAHFQKDRLGSTAATTK